MKLNRRRFASLTALLATSAIWMMACSTGERSAEQSPPGSFVAMTYNVRYDNPDDGKNAWPNRLDIVEATIREAQPDFMGVQEALAHQMDWLKQTFPEYMTCGQGRGGGRKDEYSAVFVRRDRFQVEDTGDFWLSETPNVPGSMGWDAACTRMVTWVKLRDLATGRQLVAMNTHLDHRGKRARREGSEMIVDFVASLPREIPVILTGDFNSVPKGFVHGALTGAQPTDSGRCRLRDTWYDVAQPELASVEKKKSKKDEAAWEPEPGTSHRFNGKARPGGRIDWILVSEQLEATSIVIHDKGYEGRYPSDHYPVYATILYR